MKRTYSLIATALFVSLFIYLFYRSQDTVVNELIVLLLSPDIYANLRIIIADALPLNEPVMYSLPGGLWVFSVTILAKDLYATVGERKLYLVFVPILFSTGLEFFQLLGLTNGTFDLVDIAFYLVFWIPGYREFRSAAPQHVALSPFTPKGFICMACFFAVYLAHVSQ